MPSFKTTAGFMGVVPIFMADHGAVLGSAAFNAWLSGVKNLRGKNLPPDQRIEAIATLSQTLVAQVLPKQIHHYQLAQNQSVQLTVDDKPHDIEMWWPRVLPGSTATPAQAKPCCAMFAVRPHGGQVQIQVAYRPSMLWVNPHDPTFPVLMVVNTEEGAKITPIADPPADNALANSLRIIQTPNLADNLRLDPALTATAAILSGQQTGPDIFPQRLAQMLGLGGARHQLNWGR
jgi:hypothetical protein